MEIFKLIADEAAAAAVEAGLKESANHSNAHTTALSPWGKNRLNRFKTVNGKRYQLHATRGWKAA